MLMPLPATLRSLVTEYETLLAEELRAKTAPGSRRLRDLAYTLCVSTGTRDIADAIEAARSYLARAVGAPAGSFTSARRPGLVRLAAARAGGLHRDGGAPFTSPRSPALSPGHPAKTPPAVGAAERRGK
ncbi:DUF5133 domain-containing protein [Streptomyces sp. NPDC054766]